MDYYVETIYVVYLNVQAIVFNEIPWARTPIIISRRKVSDSNLGIEAKYKA